MKKIITTVLLSAAVVANAQILKTIHAGGSKKAWVGEQIGITDVEIHYDRPAVKGREGKIYGPVVHKGFEDPGFGTSKAAPWRAGANENTTIEFSTPVKINGQELEAGKYGLFIAYDPEESLVIFSRNATSWGSYFYDEREDALRIKVKPQTLANSVEWLKYEFTEHTENSAVIAMQWERQAISFMVEADLVQTRMDNYRLVMRNLEGFRWETCVEGAKFCLNNEVFLDEGLRWAQNAVYMNKNFTTLSTQAALLQKTGHPERSDSLMAVAMEIGSMLDLYSYGRKLLFQKKNREALEVLKLNARKYPGKYLSHIGLVRAYSANGDYRSALSEAKAGLKLAPDENSRESMRQMIAKLEKGADVN